MSEIASLFVTIGAETSAFSAGLTDVQDELGTTQSGLEAAGARAQAFGSQLQSVGAGLTAGITLPIVGIGGAALTMAADFDQAMRNVNAIAQLPEEQFQALKQAVLEFAGTTRASAEDVAGALYNVVSAGFDADEAFTVMQASSRAAGAGLAEMSDVSRLVISALASYGLAADDAGAVTDTFLEIVNRGILDLPDLANSLGRVVPTAANLGVSLEELGLALADMTNTGLSTEEAVTRLNAVLVSLLAPSKELEAAIGELGFASGVELVEASGGALGALRALRDAGFFPTADAVAELFPNIRAMGGVMALLTDESTLATGAVEEFGAAAEGAVERARAEQYESLHAQLGLVTSAFEAAGIALGNVLIPPLVEVAPRITSFVQAVSQANPEIIQLGVVIAGLAAAVGPLTILTGMFIEGAGAIASFVGAAGGIGGVLSAAGAAIVPVTATVAALTAGVAALYLAWRDNWFGVRDVTREAAGRVGELLGDVKQAAEGLATFITGGSFAQLGGAIIDVFGPELGAAINERILDMRDFVDFLAGEFRAGVAESGSVIQGLGDVLLALAPESVAASLQVLVDALDALVDLGSEVADNLGGALSEAFGLITSGDVTGGLEVLAAAFGTELGRVLGFIEEWGPDVVAALGDIGGQIGQWLVGQAGDIVAGVLRWGADLVAAAPGIISTFVDAFLEELGPAGEDIRAGLEDLVGGADLDFSGVITTISESLAEILELTSGFVADVTDAFETGSLEGALDAFEALWPEFRTAITTELSEIIEAARGFGQDVLDALGLTPLIADIESALQTAAETVSPLIDQLREGFQGFAENVAPALEPLRELAGVLVNDLLPVGLQVSELFGTALVAALGALVSAISGALPGIGQVVDGVVTAITGVLEILIGAITGTVEIISALIDGDWAGAWEAAEGWVTLTIQGIGNILLGLVDIILGVGSAIVGAITAPFELAYDLLVGGSIIPDLVTEVVAWFVGLPGAIASAIMDRIGTVVDAGRNLAANLVNSLIGAIPAPIADILGLSGIAAQSTVDIRTTADPTTEAVIALQDQGLGVRAEADEPTRRLMDFAGTQLPVAALADENTRRLLGLHGTGIGVGVDTASQAQLDALISQLEADYDVAFVAGPETETLFGQLGVTAGQSFGDQWLQDFNDLFNNFEDLFPPGIGGPIGPVPPVGPTEPPWVRASVAPLPLPVQLEGLGEEGVPLPGGGPTIENISITIIQNPDEPTQELIDRLIFELEQLCQAQGGFMA